MVATATNLASSSFKYVEAQHFTFRTLSSSSLSNTVTLVTLLSKSAFLDLRKRAEL